MAPDTQGAAAAAVSPFLDPGPSTRPDSLAIVQLSRDSLLPVYLRETKGEHDGYAEGAVVNTRFGSFPHSTMIGVPWGSQIRASKVDTGSRGRKRKRAREDDPGREEPGDNIHRQKQQQLEIRPGEVDAEEATNGGGGDTKKEAVAASSGFVHILPPTPELWTASLPHRTQVVYTPDYSYVLHRLRARPGTRLIEAGAGSGSFTHAAVRAVYNGYPAFSEDVSSNNNNGARRSRRKGKVFSFEFHEERHRKMEKELADHGLEGLVHLTHRNVYEDGFLVDGASPEAEAVFLDLPAPWEALPHLSRQRPPGTQGAGEERVSPLNPAKSAYICTFSPCIEQVTRTVSTMRRLGWVDIEMVEIANRKLQVFHDRIGLHISQEKGANMSPSNVEEAVTRLADIEERFREYSKLQAAGGHPTTPMEVEGAAPANRGGGIPGVTDETSPPSSCKPFAEGRLITRGEPEIKTHTSYLVFAILPREWTEEDEAKALQRWPCGGEQKVIGSLDKATRRKEKREKLEAKGNAGKRADKDADGEGDTGAAEES